MGETIDMLLERIKVVINVLDKHVEGQSREKIAAEV